MRLFLLLALCLGTARPALSEITHSEDTALASANQRPVYQPGPGNEIERLRRQVLAAPNPSSLAWWNAAQNFAAKVPESNAREFAREIPEGARRDQFLEMLRARSVRDTATLRARAFSELLPAAREAAEQELRRRETNPDAALIESTYRIDKDAAVDTVEALAAGDDDYDAEVFARLVGNLNTTQREALLARAGSLVADGEPSEIAQRIVSTIRIAQKAASPRDAFEEKFSAKYAAALSRNVAFNQTAIAAASGDRGAKDEIARRVEGNRKNVDKYVEAQRASGNDETASALLQAVRSR